MNNFSPRAEPVTWSVVIAAFVAAGASYGFNITNELLALLVMVGPFIIAGIVSRFSVYAPDTMKEIAAEQYKAGTPPTEPPPEVPPPG